MSSSNKPCVFVIYVTSIWETSKMCQIPMPGEGGGQVCDVEPGVWHSTLQLAFKTFYLGNNLRKYWKCSWLFLNRWACKVPSITDHTLCLTLHHHIGPMSESPGVPFTLWTVEGGLHPAPHTHTALPRCQMACLRMCGSQNVWFFLSYPATFILK